MRFAGLLLLTNAWRSRKLQDNKYINEIEIFCKGNGSVFLNFVMKSNLYDIRKFELESCGKQINNKSVGRNISMNFDPFCDQKDVKNPLKLSTFSSQTEILFDISLNIPGINLVVNRFSLSAKCSFSDKYPVNISFPAELDTEDLGVFEESQENQEDFENVPTNDGDSSSIYPSPCYTDEILRASSWCISETENNKNPVPANSKVYPIYVSGLRRHLIMDETRKLGQMHEDFSFSSSSHSYFSPIEVGAPKKVFNWKEYSSYYASFRADTINNHFCEVFCSRTNMYKDFVCKYEFCYF